MNEAERGLHDLLLDHITADDRLDTDAAALVLAAWEGDDALAAALDGRPGMRAEPSAEPARDRISEVYLAAVHVEGFRGVGAAATLELRPGPGLTLVTGRNGSGKSSFAEAAELALTGESRRWKDRSAVWRDGWRNLHTHGPVSVGVDLLTAGIAGMTRISRTWDADDGLDDGRWTRQPPGGRRETFDGTEWAHDIETYRPFLSYSELGAVIDGRPSDLHDALKNLLGLGPLGAAQTRLRSARKQLSDQAQDVSRARRALCADLSEVADERATRAAELLKPTAPDLTAVAELALGTDDDVAEVAALRQVTGLSGPDPVEVAAAAAAVRSAADRLTELTAAEVRSADEIAKLLRAALHHHESGGEVECPVCGQGRLDASWRSTAVERAERLEHTAGELRQARTELSDAVAGARRLAEPVPGALHAGPLDTGAATAAWEAWHAAARAEQPAALAHALDSAVGPLVGALAELRERAEAELARRDEVWGVVSRRLGTWHDAAQAAAANEPGLATLKRAETWLSDTSDALRDERLEPFAAASQAVWQQLRQQSNVELGPVRLEGANTRRRVSMDVSVDGADGGAALGVMSQGELHALGLSLFLPRATVDQSPFRFAVIDDPVQAMDPAKVDGLARVLAEIARRRQVVVFTHDDRLADAVRRLELPATIWEVQRRERSSCTLRRSDDPVQRYLDDARAIASTEALPADLRGELVASCCRGAIEAAAHTKTRRVRLSAGAGHSDVEAALTEATTTHAKVTLAVYDDPGRDKALMGRLNAVGPWAADALQACRKGAHHGYAGDLHQLVKDVRGLTEWLQK